MKKLLLVLSCLGLVIGVYYRGFSFRPVAAPVVGKYHESQRSQILLGSPPPYERDVYHQSVVKAPAAKKPLAQKLVAQLPWFVGKSSEAQKSEIPLGLIPSNERGVDQESVIKAPAVKKPLAEKPVAQFSWFDKGESAPKSSQEIPDTRRPNPYPIPKRFDLGHIEGKGIGYDTGYTKLSVILGPEYRVGHHVTLLELRGVVFDDGKFAANAGLIGRFLSKSFCEIFGWNIFYDYRQGSRGNYNQISGGFEVLNKRWELHINGGAPVGKRKHTKKCVFDNYIGPYREVCKRSEAADYFADGSLGYYFVNGKNFQMYLGVGSYYINGPINTSAVGGKAVLRPQFGDVLSVELSVSHDHLFDTIYQVNAVLTLPLYRLSPVLKKKRGPCGMTTRQVYQPIDRDMILYKRCCCHNNF